MGSRLLGTFVGVVVLQRGLLRSTLCWSCMMQISESLYISLKYLRNPNVAQAPNFPGGLHYGVCLNHIL